MARRRSSSSVSISDSLLWSTSDGIIADADSRELSQCHLDSTHDTLEEVVEKKEDVIEGIKGTDPELSFGGSLSGNIPVLKHTHTQYRKSVLKSTANKRKCRERLYIDAILGEVFRKLEKLEKQSFQEFIRHYAGANLSEDMVTDLFDSIDRDNSERIDRDKLRKYLVRLGKKRKHIMHICGGIHKDWAFLSTLAYFVGSLIYLLLASSVLHDNIKLGNFNNSDTFTQLKYVLAFIGSLTYMIGSLGFGALAIRTRNLYRGMKRERELNFYSAMIGAGRRIVEGRGNAVDKVHHLADDEQ